MDMTPEERDLLIEAVCSAWRNTDLDGNTVPPPAWHDLDGEGRIRAAEAAGRLRLMESALDPKGLSSTGHRVLARILASSDQA